MTEENKKSSITWNINITGGSGINNVGSTFAGNSSGGTINIGFQKTCRICRRSPVGLEYPDECKCEKEGNHCEYCQSSESDKKSCSCHKNRFENKTTTNQTFINVKQGHAIVGNHTFGNNTDLSSNTSNHHGDNIASRGGVISSGIINTTSDNISTGGYHSKEERLEVKIEVLPKNQ